MATQLPVMQITREELPGILEMLSDPGYRMAMVQADLETLQCLEMSAVVACIRDRVPVPDWLAWLPSSHLRPIPDDEDDDLDD